LIRIGALALVTLLGATASNPVRVSAQDAAAIEAAGVVNTAQDAVDTEDEDVDSGR